MLQKVTYSIGASGVTGNQIELTGLIQDQGPLTDLQYTNLKFSPDLLRQSAQVTLSRGPRRPYYFGEKKRREEGGSEAPRCARVKVQ
jgi:hypothetical protein